MPIPKEPVIFLKAPNTTIGPYDNVLIPRDGNSTDWEVELGVVIGKEAQYLDSPEVQQHVWLVIASRTTSRSAPFNWNTVGNGKRGKSWDTFCPLGPWMATPNEIANVETLTMRLWMNGTLRQNGSTAKMIFGVHHLVH